MRGVAKRWPPRNVSPDGQPPATLKEAEQDLLASLPLAKDRVKHARSKFDSLDKKKLREPLVRDQRCLCVYCEDKLEVKDDTPQERIPHIEHWRPLSDLPEKALCWDNLYLSCPNKNTCDGAKGDRRLACEADEDLPRPCDAPYHEWIGFTNLGRIYVRADARINEATRKALELAIADQQDGARVRCSILNLNDRELVAARKRAIDIERARMAKDYPDEHASREERHARAAKLLEEEHYPSFVSIRVAYLRKTLGKHQP